MDKILILVEDKEFQDILTILPDTKIIALEDYWSPTNPLDKNKLYLAHYWCQLTVRSYLEDGCSVIVTGFSDIERNAHIYKSIAKDHGATFFCINVKELD